MTEKIKQSLRDSKTARWTVLGLIAFLMMTGYLFTDVLSPLKNMLESKAGWDSTSYGFFTGAYGLFNVWFFMLIIGGIILDKLGVRFSGLTGIVLMIGGGLINYYGLTEAYLNDGFGYGFMSSFLKQYTASAKMASFGYAIFGVGVELAGITVSKIIVKWFKGKEMALAMGLEMAVARLGMLCAFWFAPQIAGIKEQIITRPVGLAILLLVIGALAFIIYISFDVKLENQIKDENENSEEDQFRFADITKIVTNKAFILIALLCVLFYSAVFPFMKYAADLMHHKYGMDLGLAGIVAGLLPLGTIALTPIFGTLYDHKGKGATIMIIGAVLLIIVHLTYALAPANAIFAYVAILILGVGFSLVPSAMWPSVPKIIPESRLGTAFAVIFWVQNIGLWAFPMLIGGVLDKVNPGVAEQINRGEVAHYNYTVPMLIFVACGVVALVFAILLKAEDKKKGYGLELPNIQK